MMRGKGATSLPKVKKPIARKWAHARRSGSTPGPAPSLYISPEPYSQVEGLKSFREVIPEVITFHYSTVASKNASGTSPHPPFTSLGGKMMVT